MSYKLGGHLHHPYKIGGHLQHQHDFNAKGGVDVAGSFLEKKKIKADPQIMCIPMYLCVCVFICA